MKKPRIKEAAQKFAEALANPKPVRNIGNAIAQANPRAIMGGNTRLDPKSMKAVALSTGRPSNLNIKNEFVQKGQ